MLAWAGPGAGKGAAVGVCLLVWCQWGAKDTVVWQWQQQQRCGAWLGAIACSCWCLVLVWGSEVGAMLGKDASVDTCWTLMDTCGHFVDISGHLWMGQDTYGHVWVLVLGQNKLWVP
jgi:hypothetical protein